MKKSYILSLFLLLATTTLVAAQEITSTIEIQKGEKWWGLFSCSAPMQPFSQPFNVNTAEMPNTTAMMVSSNGRYIWSGDPARIEFDGKKITITSPTQKVEAVKGGKTLREAYLICRHRHVKPDGTAPDQSLFSSILYHSTNMYEQEEVLAYAQHILDEGFKPGIIVIPDRWRSVHGYHFDPELFGDPKGLTDKLHSMGFKAMLTISPVLTPYGREYGKLADGLIIHKDDGVFYNLAEEEVVEKLTYAVTKAREYGFDGFVFDGGSIVRDPGIDDEINQLFVRNWAELGRGISLCLYLPSVCASNTAGVNSIEVRDVDARQALNDVFSAGMAGYTYSTIYARGYNNHSYTDEQVAAYMRLQAVMPVSNAYIARDEVADPKLYEAIREAVRFRESISAYMTELAADAARTAEPIVRNMEYQFPKQGFSDCTDQFMLGPKYLFIINPVGVNKRMVRLPKGTWVDSNGRKFKGPVVTEVDCSQNRVIYFEHK